MPTAPQLDWSTSPSEEQSPYEAFEAQPGPAYIRNIEKNPGLFDPVRQDMQGQYRAYAQRAKQLTQKVYDQYRIGDPDTVGMVQDWERRTLGAGYNDTPAGQQLKADAFNKWGSKTTMTNNAIWETYMSFYQRLLGTGLQDETIPDSRKADMEAASKFDSEGREHMQLEKLGASIYAK